MSNSIMNIGDVYYRLERGEHVTNAPFGYVFESIIGTRFCQLVVDEEAAKMVKIIFDMYVSRKYTIKEISKIIAQDSTYRINPDRITWILKCRFYIGFMNYRGKEYKHIYPCLIDINIFNEVQQILNNHIIPNSGKKSRIKFSGLYKNTILCNQCKIYISGTVGDKGLTNYRCSQSYRFHNVKTISETKATKYILDNMRTLHDGLAYAHLFNIGDDEQKRKVINHLYKSISLDPDGRVIFDINEIISLKDLHADLNILKDNGPYDILRICISPTDINTLLMETGLNSLELQQVLFDLQLEGKIEEIEMGVWKTK